VTPEPVPWSARSLLYVLTNAWQSVFEELVGDMDRRAVHKAVKSLGSFEKRAARMAGPANADVVAAAFRDIGLLLNSFPLPQCGAPGLCCGWVRVGVHAKESRSASTRRALCV